MHIESFYLFYLVAQVKMSHYMIVMKKNSFVIRIFEYIQIIYANIRILILVFVAILTYLPYENKNKHVLLAIEQ